jgi:hypothetical protein
MHVHARRACALAAGIAVVALAGCASDGTSPLGSSPSASVATTGNGAPSGSHFTLNIIGVEKGKSANMDNAGGSVIFAALGGKTGTAVTTKIELNQSAAAGEFQVLDKNGTDGTASFSLPAPGTYTVWARALGTPGGMAKITTCADAITGTTATDPICSTQNEVFVRGTKADQFRDVTTSLTTIQLDPVLHADAVTACGGTTVNLFDPCLEGYFWQYDNNGLRVLQVRFYSTAG